MTNEIYLSETLKVYNPKINFFIDKLDRKEFFSFCKLNHAFWDVAINHLKLKDNENYPAFLPQGWLALHGRELLADLLLIVKDIPKTNIFLGVSNMGVPDLEISKNYLFYYTPIQEMAQFIKNQFPEDYKLYYGPIWKKYAIENSLLKFMKKISNYPMIVVGLKHLSGMKQKLKIDKFYHVVLDYKATLIRESILKEIINIRSKIKEPVVILFQAGESVSTWLIYHLRNQKNTFLLDMGRAIDLWSFKPQMHHFVPDINNQMWVKMMKPKIF
jgi:hypothetical protein